MQKKLERLLAQISSDDDDDDNKFVTPTNSKKGTKNKAPPPRSPSRSPSRRSPPRSKATNSHLNLSIQHFIHEIQLQTAASSAGVRKSRTSVLARINKRRDY